MLALRDLSIDFPNPPGLPTPAVLDASLTLHPGQTLAVVGESGSGKSLTALALMGLLPPAARITTGSLTIDGASIPFVAPSLRRSVASLAMIFQEPMSALNPCMTIGDQLTEAITLHQGLRGRAARAAAAAALAEVGITDPAARLAQHPHEFSGGMCQRVLIAIALACRPAYLLADEPTTALDVTVQAQILDLLEGLKVSHGLGVLLITHDLGVVGERADAVCVMYAGRVVEYGPARGPDGVLAAPMHPYTRALLACAPRLTRPGTPRLERLPTVADMIDERSLAIPTDLGPRQAWWPGASTPTDSPPSLRLVRTAPSPRWLCVHPHPADPASPPPDGAPTQSSVLSPQPSNPIMPAPSLGR